ncbi:MAG: DUF3857 domain-containing protein [Bacteroidetes bacterium]|nr:DUF3857 domain-containing protein [Bacteroidota bacterium]
MKRATALFFCIGLACSVKAQNAEVAELARQYQGQQAVVLNNSEKLSLQFEGGRLVGRRDVHREVLLLSDQAVAQYATDEVYHGFQQALTSIDAATLAPVGNRYKTIQATDFKTTQVQDDNIFYNDTKQTEVRFAKLGKYARTRLDYSLVAHDVHFLSPFYFQSSIPQYESRFELRVPRGVDIGFLVFGLYQDRIRMSREERRNETIYSWTATDMPALKAFDNAPSLAYYIPQVSVYVKSYEDPKTGAVKPFLASVDALYHWYYGFIKNVNLKPNAFMSSLVDSLTKGVTAPREKAARIYGWVQDHIRYVAYEDSLGGFIPRDAPVVCTRRFGDCKDMSNLLVSLCRYAGIDAHVAWIGTRDIPYRYEDLPTPMNDNHMICMARMDGAWLYLDGTDRDIPFGIPPSAIQGKEALVSIDAGHFEIVETPVLSAGRNLIADTTEVSLEGADAKGRISMHLSGYPARDLAAVLRYTRASERQEALKKFSLRGSGRYILKDAQAERVPNEEQSLLIRGEIKLPDFTHPAGGDVFLNLNLQKDFEDEYVDTSIRNVPISHDYCQTIRRVVALKIPDGYKPSYLPPDVSKEEAGLWGVKIHYELRGNTLWLTKEMVVETLSVPRARLAAHNQLVTVLNNAGKESVVLSQTK